VPGCLVVLNKRKTPERQGKILVIWAARHYQNANPQNLLRRADCMRVLVPWRAFGDLTKCRDLVQEHERALIAEIEHELDATLADIETAYRPFLEPLQGLRQELAEREAIAEQEPPSDKEAKKRLREEQKANAERLKELKRELKGLAKMEAEAEEKRAAARQQAAREVTLVRETAEDMQRIYAIPGEAKRYFAVLDRDEASLNEFNLNVPRYVDTAPAEPALDIQATIEAYRRFVKKFEECRSSLDAFLGDGFRG
jgi:type I restriction enzyme M protein